MNLLFAEAATSNLEALISWLPFVVFIAIVVFAFRQVRKNQNYMSTALKVAKENQELHKETVSLLKEISAKLNK